MTRNRLTKPSAYFKRMVKVVFGMVLGSCAVAFAQAPADSSKRASDAVADAQTPKTVRSDRPEQKKTDHDRSDIFYAPKASSSSPVLKGQPKEGKVSGFDFFRDPLSADQPFQKPEDITKKESAGKADVMDAQKALLERRYNLAAKLDPAAKMSRGKPLAVGPTARLSSGMTWEKLAETTPEEIKSREYSPTRRCRIPKQATGGQVFPQMQIEMFPRLERFDVDFDLPEAFLPEFPPAIFLQNRPGAGRRLARRGRLDQQLLPPVQGHPHAGAARRAAAARSRRSRRRSSTRPTTARPREPSLGVTCFDCHVNGHTTGQFHLNPDIRPQERRFRLDTTSLRGVFNQQIHGSKRSLRSVEDFTEFEQRTAYFNGDPIHAMKKGMNILDRIPVSHMAQMQNMLDFPPAPKLDPSRAGSIPAKATRERAARREALLRQRRSARTATRRRSTSTTRCTTCSSSGS